MLSIQDKISKLLSTANSQQPFSQQKGGQRYRTLKCLKDILKFLSDEEIRELLNTYLISRERKYIIDQLDLQYQDKYKNIINNIKELYENTTHNNKYKVLSLVSNDYIRKELLDIGFKFSPGQFTRSRKTDIIFLNKKKLYNKEIDPTYLSLLYENSQEAVNRTVYIKEIIKDNNMNLDKISLKRKSSDSEDIQPILSNKKIKIYTPVRYLNNSISNLYKKYKQNNPTKKISRSSFYNNIPKKYKKTKKFTDLCPICEGHKKNMQYWRSLKSKLSIKTFQLININILKTEIKYGKYHKIFIDIQRACFHAEIFNLKSQHSILLIDFKENLKLRGSLNELNQDFYNRKNCLILGICLIYKDNNNKIKKSIRIFFQMFYHMMVYLLKNVYISYFLLPVFLNLNIYLFG